MEADRLFWVLLTIFGSVFATGIFVISERFWLGLSEVVFGVVGLIWLIRDHLTPTITVVPIKTPLIILASMGVSIFAGYTFSQFVTIKRTVTRYVLPRTLTEKQTSNLQKYLSQRKTHPVAVKVNPLDSEALQYASQLFNALKQANWDATFDTSDRDPNTLNNGLTICVVGSNAGPPDPKQDPQQLIQAALAASNIEVNGGASIGAGEYKLFILVGRRPLVVGSSTPTRPMLVKVGQWITSLGYR